MVEYVKNFIKKYKIICLFLVAIPIVATIVFVLWGNCISDLSSFIGGLLAYIGTAALGIVAVWQNERLNELSSEYQEKLVRTQIKHSQFIDIKKSVTEAVTSFDVHKSL